MIEKFEDLNVWQESMLLVEKVYNLLKDCKDYGFKDQIQRASVSIPSNISEGFDRHTNKEFIHFLHIAKGSVAEVRTQLYLAKSLKYINDENADLLIEYTKKISAMLYKLIKTRNENF